MPDRFLEPLGTATKVVSVEASLYTTVSALEHLVSSNIADYVTSNSSGSTWWVSGHIYAVSWRFGKPALLCGTQPTSGGHIITGHRVVKWNCRNWHNMPGRESYKSQTGHLARPFRRGAVLGAIDCFDALAKGLIAGVLLLLWQSADALLVQRGRLSPRRMPGLSGLSIMPHTIDALKSCKCQFTKLMTMATFLCVCLCKCECVGVCEICQ